MGSLSTPQVIEDCFGLLKLYSDGSIYRSDHIDFKTSVHDDGSTVWKDSLFDETHLLHLRLYKPQTTTTTGAGVKLPIVLYIHGGGFCFGSRTFPNFHNCCLNLGSGLQALIISPDFRLAPENRLPAAVDDGLTALEWLRREAVSENGEEWLRDGVDFERVYIMGDSAGGNIAHHLAVRFGAGSPDLGPIRVRGYVLLAPFFGGVVRTKSEKERPCEEFWTLHMYDRFWRLSIPDGANLDHPLVNPFGPSSPSLKEVAIDPILVIIGGNEILRDRVEDYAMKMKEMGKKIDYVEYEGKYHGFFTDNSFSDEAKGVMNIIKCFMSENSS